MILTVVQRMDLRGAGPEARAPRTRLHQSPTEMTGALIGKHLQKGEERADFRDTWEEKQAAFDD